MNSTSSSSAAVSRLTSLDLAIEAQKCVLRKLCIERNAALPISRLPNEIFSGIFLHHVRSNLRAFFLVHDAHSHEDAVPSPYMWLRLAHVCSHWRSIALASPRLWTHVDAVLEDRTEAFIERCRSLPLVILPAGRCSSKALHMLFANIHRVCMLDFSSALRTGHCQSLIGACTSISPTATLSNLTAVKMRDVPFQYVKPFLRPHLTRLALENVPATVRAWRVVLATLPALEQLELHLCALGSEQHGTSADPSRLQDNLVVLPRLQKLRLTGADGGYCGHAQLLKCLAFPSTTTMRLDASDDPWTLILLPSLIKAVETVASCDMSGDRRRFRTCRMHCPIDHPGGDLVFELWPTILNVADPNAPLRDDDPGKLTLSWNKCFVSRLQVIRSFLSMPFLSDIRALMVTGLGGDGDIWPHCAVLRHVTDLAISDIHPALLIDALVPPRASPHDQQKSVLFPELHTLTMRGVTWNECPSSIVWPMFDHEKGEERTLRKIPLAKRLQGMLLFRRCQSVPICKLNVPRGAHIDSSQMLELEQSGAVEAAEWNQTCGRCPLCE